MIWIDQNENATSGIPLELIKMGLPVMIGSAPIGEPEFDYIIDNIVCVERKEIEDYFQSKQKHHLDKQLYDMSHNFSLSYLVIIGNPQNYMKANNILPQTFYSSYIGCSLKTAPDGKQGPIIVNDVPTDEDFILWLKILHDKVKEGNFTRLPKFELSHASNQDLAVNLLCSLPSIGVVRAKEILKKYGSLSNALSVFLLKEDATWQIKGLTPQKEKKIHEILNFNYSDSK
jgi:ERCC4-type nuclease